MAAAMCATVEAAVIKVSGLGYTCNPHLQNSGWRVTRIRTNELCACKESWSLLADLNTLKLLVV